MEKSHHEGGCLCGTLRYEVTGALSNPCYCHCHSCRRGAGASMVAWGTIALEGFRVTRGTLTEYRSSPPVLRGFCATCGTCITYKNSARPREIDVTLASLDAAASFAPQMHVWVADKLPWISIADDLPQFAGGITGGSDP